MFTKQISKSSVGTLHVAELAREAKVTPATVRYYARIGLLNPEREAENGYRSFTMADLRRIAFIRKAQALGLTIGDIKSILESANQGEIPCDQVHSLVEERLASIQERIAKLAATEERIIDALAEWQRMGDPIPSMDEICPLIERAGKMNGRVSNKSRASVATGRDCGCNYNMFGTSICVPT